MTGGLDGKSSTTTIAGNMEFNGDLKLDSGFRTVTVPGLGNPNLPLEYMELKTFDTPLDFAEKNWTAYSDLDSDGNIIFVGGISGIIYKSTPTGEITALTTITVLSDRLKTLAVDKTDNTIYIDRGEHPKVAKVIKQGTVIDYNVTASGGEFLINGSARPHLKLYIGVTYRFILNSDVVANHPFFLTSSSVSWAASANAIHSGSEVDVNYDGSIITFTPSQERTTANQFFYQCGNHDNMGNEITVLDKLDVPTGYVIDYEWTTWTPANADYNPMFVWNKQGDMYAVTHIPNSTLYSADKVSGDFTPLLQLTDSNIAGRAAQFGVLMILLSIKTDIFIVEGDPEK